MIKLPQKITGFEQINLGDRLGLGDLWSSFNLNLSKKLGSLLVSGRMLLNINTDDDAQLSAPPCAFKTFISTSNDIWAIAGSYLWSTSDGGPNDAFAQDATASTPTACNSDISDLCVANSVMFATQANTTIKYLNTSKAWNSVTNTLLNSSGLHQMTFFRALNRVYVVDDNAAGISSINGTTLTQVAGSTQYTLNDLVEGSGVSVGSRISCIASNTSRIGIGTLNRSGTTCKFYTWDGSLGGGGTYGPNEEYTLDATGILAVIVVDDVFTIFDTKGRLSQLNGGTFTEIARLPIDELPLKVPSVATQSPVHYNGMNYVDGNIEILINTQLWDTNGTTYEKCPSGIWCYDRETKHFYHKRSLGHTKSGDTIVEYGQPKLALVGALSEVELVVTSSPAQGTVNGKILVGADYYTNATTTKSGIFYDDSNDTLQKAGYFVTQKIYSNNITDVWNKIVVRFGRKFLNSTDKVVIKARTEDDTPTEATITYTSTTTFTVLASNFATNPAVGDEVEILQGVGAGRTAHITAVSGTTTLTITVDETITGATTQTSKARFQTWKKVGTYNAQTDDFYKVPFDMSQLGSSPWIQVKVWILWTGKNEIADLIISNKGQELIE